MDLEDNSIDSDPEGLSPSAAAQLHTITRFGLDESALVIYGRWWQLESWLRELVYLELGSRYGGVWPEKAKRATGWKNKDAEWTHMLGRDNDNPLAYLDFSQLHELMGAEWDIFKSVMPRQASWNGQIEDLLRIRHRIAHFRSPHRDDLARIEQALRDLERGAFIAASSFNRRMTPNVKVERNALVSDWLLKEDGDARRVIDHAAGQYDVSMNIRRSRRPWVAKNSQTDQPGWLWHVEFHSAKGIDVQRVWADDYFARTKELLLMMEADSPHSCMLAFSAADDLQAVSHSIAGAFEAILHNRSRTEQPGQFNTSWQQRVRHLNHKATSGSMWTIVEDSTVPITLFGTGASTTTVPDW